MTALDAAGNESPPSEGQYLNFALLPVADFAIALQENAFPELLWSDAGATIDGYDVYRGYVATGVK